MAPLGADRARRCRACYALRLAEACRVAQERGFEFVGTTLAVSPYQLFETCNDVLALADGKTPVIRRFAEGNDMIVLSSHSYATASPDLMFNKRRIRIIGVVDLIKRVIVARLIPNDDSYVSNPPFVKHQIRTCCCI